MNQNSKILATFLLGLLCGFFVFKGDNKELVNQQTLILTELCFTDFNQSLNKLKNQGYKVEVLPINYRFNEYQKVKAVARISHERLSSRIIESTINGIVKNCSTNSVSEFDIFDMSSMDNFTFYIKQLLTDDDSRAIVIENDANKIYLKFKSKR